MECLNEKPASEFNERKSDMKKIDSEYTKMKSDMKQINTMLTYMMSQKQNSSPENMDPQNPQDPSTVVPHNKKAPPIEGERSTRIGGMWTIKHEIS